MLLMSIKPKYAYKILRGEKKFELRKKCDKIDYGTRVIIYASSKVKTIIGEFKVGKIYKMPVKNLWNFVKDQAGITKEEFDSYFKGVEYGYAMEVLEPKTYNNPIPLETIREELNEPKWMPPLSYCYIDKKHPLIFIITKYNKE
ncbi:MAG: ASCH domain-containing protein [Candidatus Baldrarchaeia archaeon]